MIGKYTGFYKYNNIRAQRMLGREQTFFDIEIIEFDGETFSGEVQEEPVGHQGKGTITGKLIGNNLTFIKQMPTKAVLTPNGEIKTYNKPHPKLFYKGILVDKKFIGTWTLKSGLDFFGLFSFPINTHGTWEMRKKF
jgi:hypothetical protein